MRIRIRVIALGALFAMALLAQGPDPFGVVTSAKPPDPATVVARQVARLTSLLTLTTAQQTQATSIFTNALSAVTPLESALSTDRQSLRTAVTSNPSSIDQLAASIGTLTGQVIAIQNKADAAFYAILTSTQQTTLTQHGGFGGGFGPGPGGPPPGRP